ncbi:MAG TPA: DUF5399 family protein [Rhabdochlamydiaceae bacterium]|nr:DUF5399 family protein [Rhabdochlamydiaceae bacterium]
MARTIDNLGVDISTRYALDQERAAESFMKEARGIPSQTQIDVTIPSFTSEFEHLFGLGLSNAPWADFFAPSRYYEQKKRLFSQRLIPILGTPDKTDAELQRITNLGKVVRKEEGEKEEGKQGEQEKKEEQKSSEEELALSDTEKERKILITLLKQLQTLDQYLIDINSRRSQYQKG